MSLIVQGKVLRLIQDQRFQRLGGNNEIETNVRIIAATNRNLEEMVAKGDFREDLFYRLNGYTIELPALRERKDDIPLLLEYFLNRERRHMGKLALQGVAPSVLVSLIDYPWPGNVRQLQSVIRHSILHSSGTILGPESLPSFITGQTHRRSSLDNSVVFEAQNSPVKEALDGPAITRDDSTPEAMSSESPSPLDVVAFIESRLAAQTSSLYDETLDEVERYLFMRILQVTGGNQSKTADILGVTRGKVRDRIAHFGIQLDRAVTVQS